MNWQRFISCRKNSRRKFTGYSQKQYSPVAYVIQLCKSNTRRCERITLHILYAHYYTAQSRRGKRNRTPSNGVYTCMAQFIRCAQDVMARRNGKVDYPICSCMPVYTCDIYNTCREWQKKKADVASISSTARGAAAVARAPSEKWA